MNTREKHRVIQGAARMIRDGLRRPDVFISADPSVNEKVLMGSGNKNLVTWFMTLASSQLVLAYNPNSKFAEKFRAADAGSVPWYEVLKTPGLRFGRGDPRTDRGLPDAFFFLIWRANITSGQSLPACLVTR